MSDPAPVQVVHVHKHYHRRRGSVILGALRAGRNMIPFGGLIQNLLVATVVLWAYITYWPGDDVPLIPGVSCGAVEQPVGGVKGIAYDAADGLRELDANPPTVAAVREKMDQAAEWAGSTVGEFERGLAGAGPTMEVVAPDVEETTPVPVADCAPCPGGQVEPVPVGADGKGARVAADAALAAGWVGEDAVTAVAVAGAESDYDPEAENTGSSAKGLWQTMMSYHAPKYRAGESWDDPHANARVAHQVWSDAGESWAPWVAHTSGAYRAHMAEARQAVSSAAGAKTTPATHTVSAVTAGCDTGGPLLTATTDRYDLPGVKPWVDDAAEILGTKYDVDTIGGVRVDPGSDHHTGLAIDLMVPLTPEGAAKGDKIAADAVKHATALGVTYVIWQQRIWSVARAGEGWRPMEDRGSPTANHMDHPHLSFTATAPPEGGTLPVGGPAVDGGLKVGSYNLRVGRPVGTVVREVRRLMRTRGLDVLTVQEAAGYTPALARGLRGHQVVWDDTDTSARDSAVIVRGSLDTAAPRLHRLGGDGWPRWSGSGWHHGRSAISVEVEGVRVLSPHLPPGGPYARQLEQRDDFRANMDALAQVGAEGGQLVMVGDWNSTRGTRGPWSPTALADRIGGELHGDWIDFPVTRGVVVGPVRRPSFGGSDHDPIWFTIALTSPA